MARTIMELKFPHNLLYDIFAKNEYNNLPAKSSENTYLFFNYLLFSNTDITLAKDYYTKYHTKLEETSKKTKTSITDIQKSVDLLLSIMRDNKDVIMRDFYISEFYKNNNVNYEFIKLGFKLPTIKAINKCYIFELKPIIECNTLTELATILLEKNKKSDIGDYIEDILICLNENDIDTAKFGYFGKNALDEQFTGKELYMIRQGKTNDSLKIEIPDDIPSNVSNNIESVLLEIKNPITIQITGECPACKENFSIPVEGVIDYGFKFIPNVQFPMKYRCQLCLQPININSPNQKELILDGKAKI